MDLQWINTLVLPMLLLLGTMAAFIMILILLIDSISFYRRKLKRDRSETPSLSSPPASDISQKATPVQSGAREGVEGIKQGREVMNSNHISARRTKLTRILTRFMTFRSAKSKKESMMLSPPSAPLPEGPADTSPITSVQQSATTDAPVADNAAKSQATVSSEPSAAVQKSDQPVSETRSSSVQVERTSPIDGSVSVSDSKVEGQSATEADEKPQQNSGEETEGSNDAPKIKLKPLASLEEARKIVEAKAASKATESEAKPAVETDDVASLLGIATPEKNAEASPQLNEVIAKKASEPSDNNESIAAAEVPQIMSDQEPSADSGVENIGANKPKGDDIGEEELTAAEILMMNRGEDEILVLSKQLFELKSSLVQLEKKLKSLKEK